MSIAYLTIATLLFIGLLIVVLSFAAGAAEWWLRVKKSRWQAQFNEAPFVAKQQPGHGPAATVSAPVHSPTVATVARWNLFVAVFVFGALAILAPFPWLLFGNSGMPLVRIGTISVLLAALYTFVSAAITIAIGGPASRGPANNDPAQSDETSSHADLVARITQRFCPRCRASLAADAPEGLCPACLLAGGLPSEAANPPVSGTAATTPPSGSKPAQAGEWANLAERLPQLEILELLGRGGMGAVYRVRQKNLDRIVALKVIPPEATKDPAFAERFAREARALARFNHPNIVTVYDFGQLGDVYYLLMEYVDGVNLRHAEQASRLTPREALAVVPQICDALQYAHDQGVIHRDIKPENILLDRGGRVKIADFGLAKMFGQGPDTFTLTGTQQVMGTPRYMAPEQIEKPASVDHRADIYSLGVVIYEMLTGELPIGRFQPPSHKAQLDVRIDEVVLRALEKEPERRYQRASQVKTDLASAAPPIWQPPAPATKPSVASISDDMHWRMMVVSALGMILGTLAIAGGLGLFVYGLVALTRPNAMGAWGWMGAAFGCIGGGFGSLFGSYNTYRQLAGAEDLMHAPRPTWFDGVLGVYLFVGFVLLLAALGVFLGRGGYSEAFHGLVILGGISTLQGAGFLAYRMFMWREPWNTYSSGGSPQVLKRASVWLVILAGTGVVLLGCVGIVAVLFPVYFVLRSASAREGSLNNLRQLGLALQNYHDVYGSFPPAVIRDANGKPLYSGRVLLLPFLDQESLYRSIDLTQPWNSQQNWVACQKPLKIFMDPADSAKEYGGRTNFLFVSGQGTMFEADKTTQLNEILDGTSNTIAMVEVAGDSIKWSQPEDVDLMNRSSLPPGNHPGGNFVLFADGSVRFLSQPTSASQLRQLATIAADDLP